MAKLTDKVETNRENIIDMIACGPTYGHDNQITSHFFWSLLGETLPDDEIASFADSIASQAGYGEEDREKITETLTNWRKWNER